MGYHCRKTAMLWDDYISYLYAVFLWPVALVLGAAALFHKTCLVIWYRLMFTKPASPTQHEAYLHGTVESWLLLQKDIEEITGEPNPVEEQAKDLVDLLKDRSGKYSNWVRKADSKEKH